MGLAQPVGPDLDLIGDTVTVAVGQRVDLAASHAGHEDRAAGADCHKARTGETGGEDIRREASRQG